MQSTALAFPEYVLGGDDGRSVENLTSFGNVVGIIIGVQLKAPAVVEVRLNGQSLDPPQLAADPERLRQRTTHGG